MSIAKQAAAALSASEKSKLHDADLRPGVRQLAKEGIIETGLGGVVGTAAAELTGKSSRKIGGLGAAAGLMHTLYRHATDSAKQKDLSAKIVAYTSHPDPQVRSEAINELKKSPAYVKDEKFRGYVTGKEVGLTMNPYIEKVAEESRSKAPIATGVGVGALAGGHIARTAYKLDVGKKMSDIRYNDATVPLSNLHSSLNKSFKNAEGKGSSVPPDISKAQDGIHNYINRVRNSSIKAIKDGAKYKAVLTKGIPAAIVAGTGAYLIHDHLQKKAEELNLQGLEKSANAFTRKIVGAMAGKELTAGQKMMGRTLAQESGSAARSPAVQQVFANKAPTEIHVNRNVRNEVADIRNIGHQNRLVARANGLKGPQPGDRLANLGEAAKAVDKL